MPGLRHLLMLVRLLIEDRRRLVLENVGLRHQLVVLKRSVSRPRIQDSDRVFWILMRRTLEEWRVFSLSLQVMRTDQRRGLVVEKL